MNKYTSRKLFFVADPPHLIKKLRCAAKSHARVLRIGDYVVMWSEIVRLYEEDKDRQPSTLRVLPRLTHSHVHPTPHEMMNVRLAAQVLSGSVSKELTAKITKEPRLKYLSATRDFCQNCNDLFDCLNAQEPIRSSSDPRLQRLRDLQAWFLGLAEARAAHAKRYNLPDQWLAACTLYDVCLATDGFVELCCAFLQQYPGKFLVPRRINQDALENLFGLIRAQGAANTNPTLAEYEARVQKTVVAGQCNLVPKKGNCGGQKVDAAIATPLLPAYGQMKLASTSLRKKRARAAGSENQDPNAA